MKNLIIVILIGSMFCIANNALAGAFEFKNLKTICYIFNENKLTKKSSCTYSGGAGGNAYSAFQVATFNVHNYGKISLSDSTKLDDDNPNIVKNKIILNKKIAYIRYRDANSLQILNPAIAEKREQIWNSQERKGKANYLKCYKQTKSSLELCLIDNIPMP